MRGRIGSRTNRLIVVGGRGYWSLTPSMGRGFGGEVEGVGHNDPHQPRVMVMQAVGMLMSATCHRIKLTIRQDITSCFGKMTPPGAVCE